MKEMPELKNIGELFDTFTNDSNEFVIEQKAQDEETTQKILGRIFNDWTANAIDGEIDNNDEVMKDLERSE